MISPKAAGNYLITLYEKTKYQCESRKLQKVSIYAEIIYFLENQKRLFERGTVTATSKGLSISDLSRGPYTLIFNLVNERTEISESFDESSVTQLGIIFGENPEFPLDPQIKEVLTYVFKKVGAYSGGDLTEMSKKTLLWQNARRDKEDSESVIITDEMYKNYLNELLKDTKNEVSDRDFIITEIIKGIVNK